MARSRGERRKTRDRLSKTIREKGLSPVSRAVREYKIGERVHIEIDPSVHRGMPNPKFQGKTGRIIGMRGSAYIVEVSDGNAIKEINIRAQHLKPSR
ncbi:MAG: 50S ribosomal protein L21e [Methanocellales archaeon]